MGPTTPPGPRSAPRTSKMGGQEPAMNAPIRHADAFHKLIHENHMYGLWEIASQMTPQPRPEAIPHMWFSWISLDRKSTRLNSSHVEISYAVFCLKKKK